MEHNIDQLTQKIYQEGIEKVEQEKEKILNDARDKAKSMVDDARKQADSILKEAGKEADGIKRNTLSEIKLAGEQAISALKQRIKELISDKILADNIKEAFVDSDFLKQLILEVVREWQSDEGINVTLSDKIQKKIDEAFEKSLVKEIKGIAINFDNKLKGGFRVAQEGKAYQLTFTDEDFVEFFKPFLKKKAEEILFKK